MEHVKRVMPRDYTLFDASDLHFGALNCHTKGVAKMIAKIQTTPNAYLSMMGDAMEAILPNDKRYAHSTVDRAMLTPQAQRDALIEAFRPIADRIIAWGIGNHELKLINTLNVSADICKALGVEYGGYSYIFTATTAKGRPMHRMMLTHGAGGMPQGAKDPVQRDANRRAWLKRKLANTGWNGCVYMSMGHTHHGLIQPPTTELEVGLVMSDSGHIEQIRRSSVKQSSRIIPVDDRWYANRPSFLRTYAPPGSGVTPYSEMAMYAPADLGWLEVEVKDGNVVNVVNVKV